MPQHRTRTALALISAAACLALATGTASALNADGFDYTVAAGGATITQCTTGTCPAGVLTIPATLGGDPVTTIGDSAFYRESAITGVVIGDNVTAIGESAFEQAEHLMTLELGANVVSIGDYAFKNASGRSPGVTRLTIPASVETIGVGAFMNFPALNSLSFAEPSHLTTISDAAFKDASGYSPGVTTLTIPASVETIGMDAFKGFNALDTLSFAEPSHLTTIGESAFIDAGTPSGTFSTVTIPATVTTMDSDAFGDSGTLTSAYFLGNWPSEGNAAYDDVWPFTGLSNVTTYRFAGTLGWDPDNTESYSGGPLLFTQFAAQPAMPTAVAGTDSAAVTAGAAAIGPTPASLTITSAPEGKTCTIAGASGACTVSGLTAGTSYTFTAVAKIPGQIDSAVSFASTAVTPTGSVAPVVTPAATPTTAAATSAAPTPVLRLGSNRTTPTAIITTFTATGPGTITQTATTAGGRAHQRAARLMACSISTTTQQAGTVTLVCPLTNAAKRARLKHAVRVTLTTTYTPTGEAARRTTTAISMGRTTQPMPKPVVGPSAVTG
jgi:hypothetical protein